MSWFLEDGPTIPLDEAASSGPSASFSDAVAASYRDQRINWAQFGMQVEINNDLQAATAKDGKPLPFFSAADAKALALNHLRGEALPTDPDAFGGPLADRAKRYEEQTGTNIGDVIDGVVERMRETDRETADVMGRAGWFTGITGGLVGGAAGMFSFTRDPLNTISLGWGGVARTVFGRIAQEAAINAGVEGGTLLGAVPNRDLAGLETSGAQIAGQLAIAAGGAAAIRGAFEAATIPVRRRAEQARLARQEAEGAEARRLQEFNAFRDWELAQRERPSLSGTASARFEHTAGVGTPTEFRLLEAIDDTRKIEGSMVARFLDETPPEARRAAWLDWVFKSDAAAQALANEPLGSDRTIGEILAGVRVRDPSTGETVAPFLYMSTRELSEGELDSMVRQANPELFKRRMAMTRKLDRLKARARTFFDDETTTAASEPSGDGPRAAPEPRHGSRYGGLTNLRNVADDFAAGKEVPSHFLKIQKLYDELTTRFGLDTRITLWIGRPQKNASVYGYAANTRKSAGYVVLNESIPNEQRALATALHEFGHAFEGVAFSRAPKETKDAVIAAWKRDKARFRGKPLFSAEARPITWGQQSSFELDGRRFGKTYALRFEEWFAEQVSRWITQKAEPVTLADKFFAGIAKVWADLYDRARRLVFREGDEVRKARPIELAQEIDDFMRGLWRDPVAPQQLTQLKVPSAEGSLTERTLKSLDAEWERQKNLIRSRRPVSRPVIDTSFGDDLLGYRFHVPARTLTEYTENIDEFLKTYQKSADANLDATFKATKQIVDDEEAKVIEELGDLKDVELDLVLVNENGTEKTVRELLREAGIDDLETAVRTCAIV